MLFYVMFFTLNSKISKHEIKLLISWLYCNSRIKNEEKEKNGALVFDGKHRLFLRISSSRHSVCTLVFHRQADKS